MLISSASFHFRDYVSQEAVAFPENEGYEFRLMSGQTIRLETDGSFFIDDRQCSGDAFVGADLC